MSQSIPATCIATQVHWTKVGARLWGLEKGITFDQKTHKC